ncbi:MAG: hypothetical protein ACYDGR_04995 [Candidatus Dormibacteria bacterium]
MRASGQDRGLGRNLPPIIIGALALALMVAVLPSSLHLPVTGPGGQAEVAPVPGQGRTQANLSQLGLADSGTVGGGGSSAVGDALPSPLAEIISSLDARGPRGTAQQYHCVGNPPRQTEDPLSPPCVAAWQGDNGGVTMHGVTADQITVVDVDLYNSRQGDYTSAISVNDTPYIRTMKVLLRYFMTRFETYGRTVHIVGSNYSGTSPSGTEVDQRFGAPFAVLNASTDDYARKKIFEFIEGLDQAGAGYATRSSLADVAPYIWRLDPSTETTTSAGASWFCRSIAGKPAALANDATLAIQTRRAALAYDDSSGKPGANAFADAVRGLCGFEFQFSFDITDSRAQSNAAAMMQAQQDTTLLCFRCSYFYAMDQSLQRIGYFPEHLFIADPAVNYSGRRETPTEYRGASGISFHWRARPLAETYWWQAYQSVDSTNTPDAWQGFSAYESMLQLFSAIQLAGPHLTPANLEQGMRTWIRTSPDPFSPTASYAPGTYDFVDDFAWFRWDPSGTPPGGSQTEIAPGASPGGCYRMVDDGRRFDTTDHPWPTTDDAAARSDWPCTADESNETNSRADQSG